MRGLRSGFVGEQNAQLVVGESADEELTLQQGTKQTGILFGEEIEAFVTMAILGLGFGRLVEFFYAHF